MMRPRVTNTARGRRRGFRRPKRVLMPSERKLKARPMYADAGSTMRADTT